jgi:hypothetical protein
LQADKIGKLNLLPKIRKQCYFRNRRLSSSKRLPFMGACGTGSLPLPARQLTESRHFPAYHCPPIIAIEEKMLPNGADAKPEYPTQGV